MRLLNTCGSTTRVASPVTGRGTSPVSGNAQVQVRMDMTAAIVDDKKGQWNCENKAEAHVVFGLDDVGVDDVDLVVDLVVHYSLAGGVLQDVAVPQVLQRARTQNSCMHTPSR